MNKCILKKTRCVKYKKPFQQKKNGDNVTSNFEDVVVKYLVKLYSCYGLLSVKSVCRFYVFYGVIHKITTTKNLDP